MSDLRPGSKLFSEEDARRLLVRAAALDDSTDVSVERLREIAADAGITPQALDAAMAERPKAPWWVRLCMVGVPDRPSAMVYYWLFVGGTLLFPIAFLTGGLDRGPALLGMLFSLFALTTTYQAIAWLDKHGWASRSSSRGSDDSVR